MRVWLSIINLLLFYYPYLYYFFSLPCSLSTSLPLSFWSPRSLYPTLSLYLSLSLSLQLTGLFQFTVRLLSETEARFTSVERINPYIKVRAARLKASLSAKLTVGRADGESQFKAWSTLRRHVGTQASLIDLPRMPTTAELSVSWWVGVRASGHASVFFMSPARKPVETGD